VTADADGGDLAATAIGLLVRRQLTVGTGESITGGLIAAALTSVPGASAVFLGGIVAYSAAVKAALLGVPGAVLGQVGMVHPDVAAAMALGVRDRLGADLAVAVTGVAGPEPVDGHPVGTVHIALASGDAVRHLPLALTGTRAQIRHEVVRHALRLLVAALLEDNS